MLKVTLAQIRAHSGRLLASAIAVILATAFVAANLIFNSSMNATLKTTVGENTAKANAVILPDYTENGNSNLDQGLVDTLRTSPDAQSVEGSNNAYLTVGTQQNGDSFILQSYFSEPELQPVAMTQGNAPEKTGELALTQSTAEKLQVGVGSSITMTPPAQGMKPQEFTVSGITENSSNPRTSGSLLGYATNDTILPLNTDKQFLSVLAVAKPGVSDQQLTESLQKIADEAKVPVKVRTSADALTYEMSQLTQQTDVLTGVLMAFSAVAVLVAAMVISNTFSILVARRTKELALLRCIGASQNQIRSSVLLEALAMSFVASAVGAGAAVALMFIGGATLFSGTSDLHLVISVEPSAIIISMLVGIGLTVIAASFPAAAATRVSPLAALRPSENASVRNTKGRVRLIVGLVMLVAGFILLFWGIAEANLLSALIGGALSMVGILLSAILFIPLVVHGIGKLAKVFGVPGSLAAANAIRNPSRTASTASALLIGVTLVTMMATGASTAQATFRDTLSQRYPVDITITDVNGKALDQGKLDELSHVEGVEASVPVTTAPLQSQSKTVLVTGITADNWKTVSRNPSPDLLSDDSLVVSHDATWGTLGADSNDPLPQTLPLSGVTGSGNDTNTDVTVREIPHGSTATLMTPETLQKLAKNAEVNTAWVKLTSNMSVEELGKTIEKLENIFGDNAVISGAAPERVAFETIINVLLNVVFGLLAVAVVIALIGVANTLSLSVVERTRENSLLRALGLTRNQLRSMLAIESVLVAVVAALLGSVLGVFYGWAGAETIFGFDKTQDISFSLPVPQIVTVFVIAIVAGLLASIAPAQRAAKLSPVEGLAKD